MTASVAGSRKSSKALPRTKLAPKKVNGHCLVVCCPSDLLQLSESQWNHYIWESLETARSAAIIGQQKGPNSSPWQCKSYNQHFKSGTHWGKNFCLIWHFHLPTDYHFFKHLDNFLQETCLHNQQQAENALQAFFESWSTDFYSIGVNKHLLLAKLCWL